MEKNRKKQISVFMAAAGMSLSLAACGNSTQNGTAQSTAVSQQAESVRAENQDSSSAAQTEQDSAQKTSGKNILIAYFTVPETDGVDTVAGASRVAVDGEVFGNTEFIAKEIQNNVGGDLFEIRTVQEYPGTHNALLEFAYSEKSQNARPELSDQIENLNDYDTIFLGYPNWNADLPMPLYTFLEEYDFSGKTIIPFVTHGGSGFSGTVRTIQKLEPDADVSDGGLSVSRNNVSKAQADVKEWMDSLPLGN